VPECGTEHSGGGDGERRHPLVGELDLAYESLALTADDGLVLNAFTAATGSGSADALNMLASCATTADRAADAYERSEG
jgi:hypothetical protein